MKDRIEVVRPDDLLNLQVELENLRLQRDPDRSAVLVVDNPDQPAFLRIVFPPQTIVENAYFEAAIVKPDDDPNRPSVTPGSVTEPLDPPGTIQPTPAPAPVRHVVAKLGHPSRLVFRVPPDARIPYTTEGLLDWSRLEPSLNPIAAIGRQPTPAEIAAAPAIRAPLPNETALELPFRLVISPTAEAAWAHSPTPVRHAGRTELWHTRLELRTAPAASPTPTPSPALDRRAGLAAATATQPLSPAHTASLRAYWSPDYHAAQRPGPDAKDPDMPRTAMAIDDRHQIVVLTSAFHGYETDGLRAFEAAQAATPFAGVVAARPAFAAARTRPMASHVRQSLASAARRLESQREPQAGLQAGPLQAVATGPAIGRLIPGLFGPVPYVPQPFEAEQLMLSPLGGWLRSRGHWTPPRRAPSVPVKPPRDFDALFADLRKFAPVGRVAARAREANGVGAAAPALVQPFALASVDPQTALAALGWLKSPNEQLDLSEWVHHAAQGRDHYVRIVYEGELWPFRHRAALVKVTERKFQTLADGRVVAYLMQRLFIVVREPEKRYADGANRGSPFATVRLTTLVTPDLADPDTVAKADKVAGASRSFWVDVMTGTTTFDRFRFHAVGIDKAGQAVDFTIPLMFVSISDLPAANPAAAQAVARSYNGTLASDVAKRAAAVPGQKIAFAPADAAKPNDNTQLVSERLSFAVDAAGSPTKLLNAKVRIPQAEALLGSAALTTVAYFEDFVGSDFDAKSGVFAKVVKDLADGFDADNPLAALAADTLDLGFSADKAGGFATPNLGVSTLTRALGPLAGNIADAVAGNFDPKSFFPADSLAQLFGSFSLGDLLLGGTPDAQAPKLVTKLEGTTVVTTLDWQPKVQPLDLVIAAFEPHGDDTTLAIKGRIEKPLGGGDPRFDLGGTLSHFQVSVLKSVYVNFVSFGFTSKSGAKPDVSVQLAGATTPAKLDGDDATMPIRFAGDLKFVEELRQAIPPDLFGDGPSLDIDASGIRAGFAFTLPPIAVGVFALKDVSLGAALMLPFTDGKPTFDFNVSERAHPFQLTVSLFGGGGFFHLQLDTAGIRLLEAAFEFGAAAAIDIGVASGEVHIMAGIYFSMQRKEGSTDLSCTLTGYLRMGGSLSVLGLIRVSVEFNLSFTYRETDKAYGTATLTVHVEVLFFSKDVSLTVERQFSGSSNDPKFGEMFDDSAWHDYALAFA